MKTILAFMIFTLATLTSFAQVDSENSEHMTFKRIPIDGALDEYIVQLKKSGFSLIEKEDGFAVLKSDFAGFKDCYILVATLKQKDLVGSITVIFPERETWSSLSSNYFTLKEMLTEKYGKPSESNEKFDSSSQPRDDNDRMYRVKFDNCKYYTEYETEKGSIQLSIDHDGVASCFVSLAYFDKINREIIRAKAIDDL